MFEVTDDNGHAAWYLARPWTRRYPAGMPHSLSLDPAASGSSLLAEACARFGPRAAYVLGDRVLTYSDWQLQARALAQYWVHYAGLRAGDRVGVWTRNVPEFPIALLAAWTAGLTVVPISTAATAQELDDRVADAGAVCLVGERALLNRLCDRVSAVQRLPTIVVGDGGDLPGSALGWDGALQIGAGLPAIARQSTSEDVALLQYTGGTTGEPKAVVTTHRNLVAQLQMMGASFAERITVGRDLVLGAHPFFHSLAVSMNVMLFPSHGATVQLFADTGDHARIAAGIAGRAINHIVGGPSLYYGLLGAPQLATHDFSTLRSCFVGGMALRPQLQARWESLTGLPMTEGYGLTEVAGGCVAQLGQERRGGSVGLPCPSMELIVRDAAGHAVAPGSAGEICLRGPCLMRGYHQRADDTAQAIDAQGWLRTGDIGRVDADGFVYLLDRVKDVIVSVVDNIYPAQIEAVVGSHPGVADVCAVGMPDPELEEVVRLIVVRRDPELTAQALADWCAQHLADFKRPREIEFRHTLPRSAVGKVLRRELRERKV